MEKPDSMILATKLCWISLGIGAVASLVRGATLANNPLGPLFVIFVTAFTLGILGLIFWQVSSGKNWARITFAVLYGLGLLPSLASLLQLMSAPLTVVVAFIQLGLQGYALYLMFTSPGKEWFSKTTKEQSPVG